MVNLCPYLPQADGSMDWRSLNQFAACRDIEFYQTALRYAQALWMKGLPARSILAIDRALFCDLSGLEDGLKQWPLPYLAVLWIIGHRFPDQFIGNPRIHYQHLADRVRGERKDIKKWRAWACWYLVKVCFPEFERDKKHQVVEPTVADIRDGLVQFGYPDEVAVWDRVLRIPSFNF